MNVLLTGGAGYIGPHVVRALVSAGHRCIVYDNLSKGHAEAVEADLIVADAGDGEAVRIALTENKIEAVIHLAAFIEAGESVREPDKYFRNNTMIGLTLLESMRKAGVRRLVFSSTAAVYGQPREIPILEDAPADPINPYGASKLCVEFMLRAYAAAYGMGAVCLRYFNVAGADPSGDIGEDHDPETHLVPLALAAALGRRDRITVNGDDYDTPDGTCVRDYIHVCDLADAHVLAMDAAASGRCTVYNLGNGEGFSVKQVIETCKAVTGRDIPVAVGPRRAGDAPRLVASSRRAASELKWRPKHSQLETIVSHAWNWHKNHPNGYSGAK